MAQRFIAKALDAVIYFFLFRKKLFQLKILGVTVHMLLTNTCFTPEHTHVSGVNRLKPPQTQTLSLSIKLCRSQFGFGHEEQSCYSRGLRLTRPEMRSPSVYLKLQSDMRKIISKYGFHQQDGDLSPVLCSGCCYFYSPYQATSLITTLETLNGRRVSTRGDLL